MSEWYRVDHVSRTVDPDDRGFQYGDGLFETIAIRNGKPRLWRYHMDRLDDGCRRLGLERPSAASLDRHVEEALRESKEDSSLCIVKIVVTAGARERGYGRSTPSSTATYIGVFPAVPLDKSAYREGVVTIMCDTRLAVGSPVAGIKTLNRIEQVLARSECVTTGAFEGLVLDADNRLICGTMSNVFIVKDKVVHTPSLERCGVAGTMRKLVLEELEKTAGAVKICDLSVDELADADEVFLTNSQMGAVPVNRCNAHHWSPGPVTRDVMRRLAKRGIDECHA